MPVFSSADCEVSFARSSGGRLCLLRFFSAIASALVQTAEECGEGPVMSGKTSTISGVGFALAIDLDRECAEDEPCAPEGSFVSRVEVSECEV